MVVLSAPLKPTLKYLSHLYPLGVYLVYYGAITFGENLHDDDRYAELREKDLLQEVGNHSYQDITSEVARNRVLERREAFQLRQRTKCSRQTTNA